MSSPENGYDDSLVAGDHQKIEMSQDLVISRTAMEHEKLVGGWATPLKNMKVNWDDYSQYMGK